MILSRTATSVSQLHPSKLNAGNFLDLIARLLYQESEAVLNLVVAALDSVVIVNENMSSPCL